MNSFFYIYFYLNNLCKYSEGSWWLWLYGSWI